MMNSMRNKLAVSSIMLLAGGLGACKVSPNANPLDDHNKVQYMPDMVDGPTVKAQESFIDPPDHSVATNAILYPATVEVAEKEFKNPLPANELNLERGKHFFETYCLVCHGPTGDGQNNLLGTTYPVGVPDIARPDLAVRKDGFFFMKISQGGPMMPAYGYATSPIERWQIIMYLRQLQNKKG